MNNINSDRPKRQTTIITRELRRFWIDIAALAETRLADEGQLKEEKGEYTFFWKGKPAEHGVGFAIKNSLVTHLQTAYGHQQRTYDHLPDPCRRPKGYGCK